MPVSKTTTTRAPRVVRRGTLFKLDQQLEELRYLFIRLSPNTQEDLLRVTRMCVMGERNRARKGGAR